MAHVHHTAGLGAQLQNKIAAKRDNESEQAALKWIFGFLGESVPQGSFEEVLRDGQALCRFMKKVDPSLINKISTGHVDAALRENVGFFVQACLKLGLRQTDIFQTNDLYDHKDIPQVLVTLGALGTILQKSHPEVPAYGPPPKH